MNQIKKILEELYTLEPSLQEKESELEKMIAIMLKLKPDIKVDSDFRNELKLQLANNILERKVEWYSHRKSFTFFQKISYFIGATGIACFGFVLFKQNIVDYAIAPALENQSFQNELSAGNKNINHHIISQPVLQEEKNIVSDTISKPLQKLSTKKETISHVVKQEISPVVSHHMKQSPGSISDTSSSKGTHNDTIIPQDIGPNSSPKNDMNDTFESVSSDMSVGAGGGGGTMSLMKASVKLGESVQDVYVYSFSGNLNLSVSDLTGIVYKKSSDDTTGFQPVNIPLETNEKNILEVALKGGKDGYMSVPKAQKTREVKVVLKNPKIAYTNVYVYTANTSQEYFAPCVIFEVDKDSSDKDYYGNEIIVPLIQDIYTYDIQGNITGIKQ